MSTFLLRALVRTAVLTLALAVSLAHADQFGNWWVERLAGQQAYAAFTSNDSGGVLGKTCDIGDQCRWVITLNVNCDRDAFYPPLANAEGGSMPLRLQCSPNETTPGRFIVTDYETMEGLVAKGAQLGLAFPMNSGEFRVSRWSINGWLTASAVLAIRIKAMKKRGGETTL